MLIRNLEFTVRENKSLPVYDQKSYRQSLKQLRDLLQVKEASFREVGPFRFKSRELRKTKASTVHDENIAHGGPARVAGGSNGMKSDSPAIKGYAGRNFILSQQEELLRGGSSDLLIQDCSESYIDLKGTDYIFSTIHILNCDKIVLISNPVMGPVFINNCTNSVLVLGCHQFRMHSSEHVACFVHVSSNPIIEDCKDITFNSYARVFPEYLSDLKKYGLDSDNKYDQVQDFNWLKHSASPNWKASRQLFLSLDNMPTTSTALCDLYGCQLLDALFLASYKYKQMFSDKAVMSRIMIAASASTIILGIILTAFFAKLSSDKLLLDALGCQDSRKLSLGNFNLGSIYL
ncbi:hypothetical protein MP638_001685 [Amoeboaphelidium occidentale]|nr:hypothetical protein MP638_001685 [Amoeboaphelidium occidentale]